MFGIQKLQLYALVGAAFVLGLLGIYSAGVARGQDKIKRKIDEKRLANVRSQRKITNEIDDLDQDELYHRGTKWMRDD